LQLTRAQQNPNLPGLTVPVTLCVDVTSRWSEHSTNQPQSRAILFLRVDFDLRIRLFERDRKSFVYSAPRCFRATLAASSSISALICADRPRRSELALKSCQGFSAHNSQMSRDFFAEHTNSVPTEFARAALRDNFSGFTHNNFQRATHRGGSHTRARR
jgi:hypothetical protein